MACALQPTDLDVEEHLNDDTRILASVLIEALGEEKGLEATCALVEQAGGLQLRIISPRTVLTQLGREKAREMFREGASVAEVVVETPLSAYQARKVKRELGGGRQAA